MFDPWADARLIAERQELPGARLLIFLGAEAWCEKCRILRPQIEAQATSAPGNDTWVWLDLEDHAEFLGNYVPEDLPQLVTYEGSAITSCQTLGTIPSEISEAVFGPQHIAAKLADPGIRANLLREDWVI
jgi:hypothetical protein